jgi:glyceraldehyde-3-phosphate dehydrogenase [NAD(P)+]
MGVYMVIAKPRSEVFEDIVFEKDGTIYYRTYLAGDWVDSGEYLEVKTPIDLSTIAKVSKLSWDYVDKALDKVYRYGQ